MDVEYCRYMYIRKYEKIFFGILFIIEILCSGIYVIKILGNVWYIYWVYKIWGLSICVVWLFLIVYFV